ncbi:antitoxin [Candidatus Roizmanbacteria bacterium CG_4_8_14_3_um_filter_34_9]|uniref:Antitoxin n=2 Tax=Candidatus Roizmaniibacteriota TaxID=1752723 RepID=A0A2M6YSW2_9BACT|nr:MAG: antitoxin [Candidatus Roizmanbacteria bacterium CG07_land_8_20_14_0_80_34_15]PIW73021.1 MAG: antitoxin [Candidatus Roizmanbacteria bacterium CG_4_8_14_3_um_filter_34_9]
MKRQKKDIFAPLDDYERDLIKAIENDEFVEVPIKEEEMKRYREAAKYTLEKMKKDKRITIRVENEDLNLIQDKAIKSGIPYQTLIASILRKFARGKINIGV